MFLQFCRILVALVFLAICMPIHAQEDDEPVLDEVVVVGQRLQNRQSIDIKRNSVQIVDTVTADDIGRQPDFNVADALKRVTGVSTIPEEDEAQFVTVRGINPDLTWVTFDGAAVASASPGDRRRVSLEFFPSSMVKGLEVVKTRTPEIDGNTIGGQVDLVSRSAFDHDGLFLFGTAFAGYFDGDGAPFGNDDSSGNNSPSYRFDGAISNTFGSDSQFGAVLAVSYFDKDRDEERIIPINFQSTGDFTDPASSFAPGLLIWSSYHNPIERYSSIGRLEWRASSNLYAYIQGMYVYQEDYARRESELLIGGTPSFDTQFSGTLDDALLILGHDQFGGENTFTGLQAALEYDLDNGFEILLRGAHTEGKFFQDSPDIDFGGHRVDVAYSYNDIGAPVVTFADPATALDPSNFPLQRVRPFFEQDENEISEVELNLSRNKGEQGWGVLGGLKYRALSQRRVSFRDVYNYTGGVATLADFQSPTDYEVLYRPGVPSLFVNRGAVFSFLEQNPDAFDFTPGTLTELFEVEEDVFAAWLGATYGGDSYSLIAGVRYEDTSVDSRREAETQSGSYDNLLPSVLLTYDLGADVKLRLSYAMAVGRANPGQLTIGAIEDPTAQILSIDGGNPGLKAREADNYDASLEYYFDDGDSMASIALFRKDIDNEIFVVSREGTFNGQPAILNTPTNAESSELTGFEIGFIKSAMEFLPYPFDGFGVSLNYTYIDAETTLLDTNGFGTPVPFVFDQPDEIINAALFYQLGGFEGKLAYAKTSAYHAGFAGDPGFTDQFAEYETLDLQIRYDFGRRFSFIAEARNLTDEPNERRTGPGQVLLNDLSEFDRSYFVGISYRR